MSRTEGIPRDMDYKDGRGDYYRREAMRERGEIHSPGDGNHTPNPDTAGLRVLGEVIADAMNAQPDRFRPELGSDLRYRASEYQTARLTMALCRDSLVAEVRNAVDAGMNITDAARLAGVTRHTLYAWLRD